MIQLSFVIYIWRGRQRGWNKLCIFASFH